MIGDSDWWSGASADQDAFRRFTLIFFGLYHRPERWRIVNTEDIVPVVPISSNQLGNTSPTSIFLNVLIHGLPAGFSHIGYPVSVTFDQGRADDNHNLDNLWATL